MSVVSTDAPELRAAPETAGEPRTQTGRRAVRRLLVVAGLAGGAWIVGSALSHSAADAAPITAPRSGSVLVPGTIVAPVTTVVSSPTDHLARSVSALGSTTATAVTAVTGSPSTGQRVTALTSATQKTTRSPTDTVNSLLTNATTTVAGTVHQAVTVSGATVSTVVRAAVHSSPLPSGVVGLPIASTGSTGSTEPPGLIGSGLSDSLSTHALVHQGHPAAGPESGRTAPAYRVRAEASTGATIAGSDSAGSRRARPTYRPFADGRNPAPSTPISPAPGVPDGPGGSASGTGSGGSLIDRLLPTGSADRPAPGAICVHAVDLVVVNAQLDAPAFSPD